MLLQDLQLEAQYRSDQTSLGADFFAPCLERSVKYDRAVGYFRSSSLAVLAPGLAGFLQHDGFMRLVASPVLSSEDFEALRRGYDARETIVAAAVDREVGRLIEDASFTAETLDALTWLVANGRLDIRLALVVGSTESVGIYHEKLGLFSDSVGDEVAFSGSANESFGGLVSNFESLDVYRSWVPADAARAAQKRNDFERLWDRRTPNIEIFEFPEAARQRLIQRAPTSRPAARHSPAGTGRDPFGFPTMPSWFSPRDYQKDAVRAWLHASGRGILSMATGSGKTLTALTALVQVAKQGRQQSVPMLAIVVCPLKHLVTQWAKDISAFGIDPLLCFESTDSWTSRADAMRLAIQGGRAPFGLMITTNATFQGRAFQERIRTFDGSVMFIADEVHNLGSEKTRAELPDSFQFRLGLSATPERHRDEIGTTALFGYFGDVVYELSIHDAIERDILCPYRYEPVVVELEDEELESYVGLTEQITKALSIGGDSLGDNRSPGLDSLLFRRARLIGGARAKISALHALMEARTSEAYSLVYCSDSAVNGTTTRQIDAVVELLGQRMGFRVAPYTFETSMAQRQDALRLFENGMINALVAIRCLDEGVDIPATRTAFILASSTNPREYVQRRGRVLRKAPGKERADIFDLIALPPEGALAAKFYEVERRLVERELTRVVEFARHATNGPAALSALLPIQERYDLLHLA